MSEEQLQERKEKFISKLKILKNKHNIITWIILALILWLSYSIRTRNLGLLKDITTNKFIPLALDPHVFLRYSEYLLEHGKLFAVDAMRYYPLGFNLSSETPVLPHFIVNLYKFLHAFNSSVTLAQADVLYPPIVTVVALFFFFLLIRKIFDTKIALLSTAFLAVIPIFLYRSIAGFSDKEALAVMFMFISFYFYVSSWHSKKAFKIILFAILAGLFTAFTGLVWGGVNFIFMIIGGFALVEILLNRFTKKDFYLYTIWFLLALLIPVISSPRFTIQSMAFSFTSGIMFVAFIMAIIDFLIFKKGIFKIKEKIIGKMPIGVATLIIAVVLIVLFASITFDPDFIIDKPAGMVNDLLQPFKDRWSMTVAESHEPYIIDWINSLGWSFFLLFFFGSILLFYEMLNPLTKHKKKLVVLYLIFLYSFIFSRYKPESTILNGETAFSHFMYVGSLVIFFGILAILYILTFYKDKEFFDSIQKMDKKYLFIIIWFLVMVMGARRAVRLLHVFAPIIVILTSYLAFRIIEYGAKLKEKYYKWTIIAIVFLIILSPFGLISSTSEPNNYDGIWVRYTKSVYQQAQYTGPSYNRQWQIAGEWARNNTPEEAVFAHWWDYGYWVQTGFKRTTITDGGNAIGPWNYFMGRHVITAQSETEALEFLNMHEATHLLMISDEIGKYPAFSSIGSDENYDRYSWINVFNLDQNNVQETRDSTIYLYQGSFVLDDDFVFEGKVYPKGAAGIGGIFVPMKKDNTSITFGQPTAAMFYNGQRTDIPLECIFFENQEIVFDVEGLKGCFRILPTIESNNQMNIIGAGLYLSEKVRRTLFTHLYLYGEESDNFKLVYNDEESMPLAVYHGSIIGPLKIWEISYPDNLEEHPEYLKDEYPDPNVTRI